MAPLDTESQFKFLITCIKHSANGKVDFVQVANELDIVSKAAAAKRYERLMKAHNIPTGGRAPLGSPAPAGSPATPKGTAKKPAAKKRKVEAAALEDEDEVPEVKPETKKEPKKEKKFKEEKSASDEYDGSFTLYDIPEAPPSVVGNGDGGVNGGGSSDRKPDVRLVCAYDLTNRCGHGHGHAPPPSPHVHIDLDSDGAASQINPMPVAAMRSFSSGANLDFNSQHPPLMRAASNHPTAGFPVVSWFAQPDTQQYFWNVVGDDSSDHDHRQL